MFNAMQKIPADGDLCQSWAFGLLLWQDLRRHWDVTFKEWFPVCHIEIRQQVARAEVKGIGIQARCDDGSTNPTCNDRGDEKSLFCKYVSQLMPIWHSAGLDWDVEYESRIPERVPGAVCIDSFCALEASRSDCNIEESVPKVCPSALR